MQLKSFTLKTKSGFEVWCNSWIPDSDQKIKAVIVFHHGICEHSLRYDRFGSVLSENGYVLFSYDMRGHGKTAENALHNKTGDFGYISKRNGCKTLVEDLKDVIDFAKSEYPGQKFILAGHSLGSVVALGYLENYSSKMDGCILIGAANPSKIKIAAGKITASLFKILFGAQKKSKILPKLFFSSYNRKIKNQKTKIDWICKDEMSIQMYNDDNWCGIQLSNSFIYDSVKLFKFVKNNNHINKIQKDLPILIAYGKEDPVSNYGKDIKKLSNKLKKFGITNIQIKEYENDRHEILNESDRDIVENDLVNWISKTLTE